MSLVTRNRVICERRAMKLMERWDLWHEAWCLPATRKEYIMEGIARRNNEARGSLEGV